MTYGGKDSGAVSKDGKTYEKDIVLSVGLKTRSKIERNNIEVRMSRDNDTYKTLDFRTNDANKWGADCLVSIHCDSFTNVDAQGATSFCFKTKYNKLAILLQDEIVKAKLYTKNRGVKEGNLHMVRESNMPAALIELAFISNLEDLNLLKTKQDEYATCIAKAVCKFLGVEYKEDQKQPDVNKPSYIVATGAFNNIDNAKKEVEELKKKGINTAYVHNCKW